MKRTVLYHHLGLGDHIVCNGLIREIIKSKPDTEVFTLLCKEGNASSVRAMFRDLGVLQVHEVKNDAEAMQAAAIYVSKGAEEIKIGFENRRRDIPFADAFYEMVGVSPSRRWEAFYVLRNPERESQLKKSLQLDGHYTVVHDDPERGYVISNVSAGYGGTIVRVKKTKEFNLMDWIGVIEAADEIHCYESCVMILADLSGLAPKRRFCHLYVRWNENDSYSPRLNWQFVNNSSELVLSCLSSARAT